MWLLSPPKKKLLTLRNDYSIIVIRSIGIHIYPLLPSTGISLYVIDYYEFTSRFLSRGSSPDD